MNTEFEPRSWTKMLRKIHLVCFILEYLTPKTRTLKILSPPPKKTMLKGHRNISGPDLTTLKIKTRILRVNSLFLLYCHSTWPLPPPLPDQCC